MNPLKKSSQGTRVVNRSKSPNKNEADIIRENFNKVVNINPENIKPAKDFINNLNSKNSSLKNKHNSTIKNANSLNILKESGFFNFDFFEKKQNTEHFNITLEEIEKVFCLIDDKNKGEKIITTTERMMTPMMMTMTMMEKMRKARRSTIQTSLNQEWGSRSSRVTSRRQLQPRSPC